MDESGDLGFNFVEKKPSRFFIITALVANDYLIIGSSVKRTLKNKLRQKKKTRFVEELKGNATQLFIKDYFYRQINRDPHWHLYTIMLDKLTLMDQPDLTTNSHRLYNEMAKCVLQEIEIIKDASIIHLCVDRSKSAAEINIFDTYIRSHLQIGMKANAILNIEHLRSEVNAGLQAVDLFCYGIARKYEVGDTKWYHHFQDRIEKEIIFRV